MGLGVGVLNKEGNPNGNTLNESIDPTVDESQFNAWRAHSLYNVTSVKFDIQRGSFHHHSVGDGSSTNAAVLAVAPLHERGGYQFKINRQFGKVYGGGNVMFLRKVNLDQTGTASVEERATGVDDSITLDQPVPLHIWSTARNVSGSKATDNGAYSLMAPDQLIRRYVPKHTSSNVSKTGTLYTFTGSADDFYKMLTLQGYKTEDQFYTVLHNVLGTLYVSYVRDDKVIKTTEVSTSDIKAVNDQGVFEVADLSPAELLKQGALLGNQNYSYTVGNTLVLDPINFKPE